MCEKFWTLSRRSLLTAAVIEQEKDYFQNMTAKRTPFDSTYKSLFKDPEMVASLLRELVNLDLAEELDFSSLRLLSGDYVTDDLRQRFNDVVWRVQWKNSDEYVIIMMEFQSSVDPWMAMRAEEYAMLLLRDLTKQGVVNPRIGVPPVLPIVIYTGEGKWTAAKEVSELVAPQPPAAKRLLAYLRHRRYVLIDTKQLTADDTRKYSGLAAKFFIAEHAAPDELAPLLLDLISTLKGRRYAELRRLLLQWFRYIILPKAGISIDFSENTTLEGAVAMYAEAFNTWKEKFRAECMVEGKVAGIAEGRAEGIAEGIAEGKAKLIEELQKAVQNALECHFAPLPPSAGEDIKKVSDPDELQDLLVFVWKVKTLQEALDEIKRHAV